MSKRCSAKDCYNSSLTNKIAYFPYPRDPETAIEWATRAGREDLIQKAGPTVLIKYYLCSDHFTTDDIQTPDTPKIFWKLKKFPKIPVPSHFENNLMANVLTAKKNLNQFIRFSKKNDGVISKKPTTSPRSPQKRTLNITEKILINSPSKKQKIEVKSGRVEFVEIEKIYVKEEEIVEVDPVEYTEEYVDPSSYCRLCTKICIDLIAIFDDNGKFYTETECFQLMPPGLISKDDGLPQYSCSDCLERLQACANTIETFVSNQNLFISS